MSSREKPAQTSQRLMHRRDGRVVRRVAVYLPARLATKLRMYCAARDVSASQVVAELIERLSVSAPRVVRPPPEAYEGFRQAERGEFLPLTPEELDEALESGELPEHAQRWLDSRNATERRGKSRGGRSVRARRGRGW